MNKRAFTLIELLAVIIVLALILLITIPIVSNIIDDSRREAFRNNVINLFDAVKKLESEGKYKLDETGIFYNDSRLNLSNNPFTGGAIKLDDNGNAYSYKVTDGRYCALGNKKDFKIFKGNCDLSELLSKFTFEVYPDNSAWVIGKKIVVNTNLTDEQMDNYDISFSVADRDSTEQRVFKPITEKETDLYFGEYTEGSNTIVAKNFYNEKYGLTYNNNLDRANLVIKIKDEFEEQALTYQVTMVDSTAPANPSLKLVKRNMSTMYVMAGAVENESYIKNYTFIIKEKGTTTEQTYDNGTNSLIKFENLKQNSDYEVTVKISNAVGGSKGTSEFTQTFTPATLDMPIIDIRPSVVEGTWVSGRTVKITYPMDRDDITEAEKNNYVYKYKVVPDGTDAATVDFSIVNAETQCKKVTDELDNNYCEITLPEVKTSSMIYTEITAGSAKGYATAPASYIDSMPPTITKTSYYAYDTKLNIHITGSDEVSGSGLISPNPYKCSVDNGSTWIQSNGSVCVITGLTKDKSYTVKIKATDNAGNSNEPVDLTAKTAVSSPEINMAEIEDGIYKKIKITFPYLGTEAKYSYRIIEPEEDSSKIDWIPVTSSTTITTPTITKHETVVQAQIVYNGTQTVYKSLTVVLDVTPPTITFETNGNSSYAKSVSTKVTITDDITGGDTTTYKYIWGSSTATPTSSLTSGNTYTKDTGTGTFYLRVYACDKAGNCTTATSKSFKVDNTNPSITFGTNGKSSYAKSVSSTISVSDDHAGGNTTTYKYVWGTSSATPSTAFTSGASYSKSSGTGTYYLRAYACDKANNCVTTTSNAFKLDNTGPTITTKNSSNSNWVNYGTGVTISGTYSDDHSGVDTSKLYYSYDKSTSYNDWGSVTSTSYSGTWSAARNQEVFVRVADKLENYSAWTSAGYVRISSPSLSISGSRSSYSSYQVSCYTSYWQNYKYTFSISISGQSISSGKVCYESYCCYYSSSCKNGYGYGCFSSSTTWYYYRSSYSANAQVCGSYSGCKSATAG